MPSLARNPVELTAANGVGSTVESLSFFLGPAIAGSLLAVSDVEPVFLLNVLTFLWSAALVAGVHPPAGAAPVEAGKPSTAMAAAGDEDEGEEPELGFVAEALAGFKTIGRHRDLLLIMVLMCGQTLVAGALHVFVVAVAVDLIELGPEGVGYMESLLGVGALVGGVVAMSRASKQRLAWDFGVGVILWALPLTLIAAWASPAAAFAAMLVIGLANPLVDVNLDTMVQRLTPDQVLGRVFGAIEAAFIGAMALGALIMPILISTIGLRWGLTAVGLGVTALVVPFIPRLLTMDRFLREPEGLALIRALPIFAPLARPVVERLALALDRLEVPAGTEIITEGDVGDKFYVIESGLVAATYRGAPLSQSGSGEPFGEIALLHDVPRTATVTAVEDTVLRVLDREDFLSAVTGNDQVLDRTEALVRRRIPTG
jgi:MFS family permease